ncbi:hypothetical protein DH2020_031651 [Rehmannia glutinosa]|uniref:Aminotransferase class I/classII large domain-containing protein n=1 Tax=Rehmannia glutinosa TaxID=99300 RepID=A0ABR0VKP9_REHGL
MDVRNDGGGHEIISIKGILGLLMGNIDARDNGKKVISLGIGDPTAYSCFYTTSAAQEAVVDALRSTKFNGALAEYLSRDLPYKLQPDDVYVTAGCTQAIEISLSILARPGDSNTVAMVIINPGNPCGNVYTYRHLNEIAETAKRLGIVVIADEVYGHLAFGANPFVPMGVFGSVSPVITLGSMSKRWLVPGWRLGWLVTNDPDGSLKSPKFVERLKKYCDICGGPATFIQVKLNVSLLKDITDDIDFCFKLAKEESVIILPGLAVGLKNWIRITFAVEPSSLEEALERVKSFCQRHSC